MLSRKLESRVSVWHGVGGHIANLGWNEVLARTGLLVILLAEFLT